MIVPVSVLLLACGHEPVREVGFTAGQSTPSLSAIEAPYGRYSLENIGSLTPIVNGLHIPSCGVDVRVELAMFRPIEVLFKSEQVFVNNREWPVVHIGRATENASFSARFGSVSAVVAARPKTDMKRDITIHFWKEPHARFRRQPQSTARGWLVYQEFDGNRLRCIDERELVGTYAVVR